MFDAWLEESLGNPSALLHLAADNLISERTAGCRKLRLAAAWADCHAAPPELEIVDGEPVPALREERYLRLGGSATPLVAESCPAEFAIVLHTSIGGAKRLIAGALTIRHRLPRLWQRVKAGEVWAWKALQIAEKTRHLGGLTSWCVDRTITPQVESMAWTRFLDLLDGTLLREDEASYQRRAAEAAAQRDVRSYRSEHGLRTLVAKVEAGDNHAFLALVERVAECLAEDGDEDPVGVRRSKAFGIIAHQARLRDLLNRHDDQGDDPRHPEERVAAHQDDPTDPWAADDLPPAGWETNAHGNYHQPGFDDLDDLTDSHTSQTDDPDSGWEEEPPVDEADRAWNDQQQDHYSGDPAEHDHQAANAVDDATAMDATAAADGDQSLDGDPAGDTPADQPTRTAVPAAFDRHADDHDNRPTHCSGCACGSTFDLRPMSHAELNASRTRAVVHVHVSDQTLIDQHGVLRTADGPITLDQFRRWLTDADANITIRPVLDPASVAAADSYEIPTAIREAMHTRHPGSVWPYSPATEITVGGRLDLDHTIPYRPGGPPGQTRIGNLGPLARAEHRAKTHAGWQVRQPDLGTQVWQSPHHWISVVTNQGTLLLGDSPFAHQVWQAAQPDQIAS